MIYAAANCGNCYGALFKTKDGGANWIRTGLRAEVSTAMALDVADSNTIYIGDYDPGGEGEAGLDKSVDGGSTWTRPYGWYIGPVNALVTDPGALATPVRLLAAGRRQLVSPVPAAGAKRRLPWFQGWSGGQRGDPEASGC